MDISAPEAKPNPDDLKGEPPDPGGSPGLIKKLDRMSINANLSSSPTASPKSPSLSRRTSSNFLRRPNEHQPALRRASSGAHASSHSASNSLSEEKPQVTAASLAKEFFQKELMYHLGSDLQETDTLVLTHDACYGHRYSRPKTPKSTLGLIVERPERLQAGMLGLASAYVRLGERHAGGSHPPLPQRESLVDIPFRIRKTARTLPVTSPAVAAVHGLKWMQELKTMCETAGEKLAAGNKELARPETPTAIGSPPKPHLHEGDLYLCKESLNAFEGALGGVCEAVDNVFDDAGDSKKCKKAFVCIRPPGHHCSADWPSGFCWINNIHVGIEHAIQQHGLTHAAIIDFDLHHGDGSQAIAWERNSRSLKAQKSTAKNAASKRSSVGYFSIHDINSYPCEDGDFNKVQRASVCIENAHGQNVWNVHLQPWTTQEEFWSLYESQYFVLLEKARTYLRETTLRLKATTPNVRPRSAIFVSAGFDASEWETPGMQRHKVSVPTEFYARITSDIVKIAQEEGLGTEGRVVSVLEGGYSDRAIASGVFSHLAGLARPQDEVARDPGVSMMAPQRPQWNPQWWSDAALRELEDIMKPIAPPSAPVKKPSGPKEIPTYQTPTQSFTAKVIDPNKIQRHTSTNMPTPPKSRPGTPPPPDVDWATAVCQLSKLLIPSEDRQVNSCRHEELNEPKKRERHSSIGLQTLPTDATVEKRQTRGRKTPQGGAEPDDRRQTMSGLPVHHEVPDGGLEKMPAVSKTSTANSAKPPSHTQSKARQPPNGAPALSMPKTRRTSLGKESLARPMAAVPSVPSLPETAGTRTAPTKTSHADVDALTFGIKKISIKLPNPSSQIGTTAAPKNAVKKPAAPRTTKNPPSKGASNKLSATTTTTPRTADIQQHTSAPDSVAVSGVLSSDPSPVANNEPTIAPSNAHPAALVEPAASTGASKLGSNRNEEPLQPTAPTSVAATHVMPGSQEVTMLHEPQSLQSSSQEPTPTAISFLPFEPSGGQQKSHPANSNFRQEPIQWLPPNMGTPKKQPFGGKENLPNFTATGHIPFRSNAMMDEAASTEVTPLQEGADEHRLKTEGSNDHVYGLNQGIWDVPVTPRAS